MFRSIFLILSGNLSKTLILMVRNLVIARLISLQDYGIASTFMLAMAIVEMMSTLGLQQQMVQAKNGNDPHLQAAMQGFQVIRALINGAILFAISGPLAAFFGHPDLTWAYQLTALIPVLQGFGHFDTNRMSRQMNYMPVFMVSVLPALGSVLLVWPLYVMFQDYRVMLYALLAQSVLQTIASHMLAERPYRLAFDRSIIASSMRFGWPILLNGILMFAIYNGERMIVGRELDMTDLALFSMAFSLSLTPNLVMTRSVVSFFLPQLAASVDDRPTFRHLAAATFQAHLLFGNLLVVGIAILGGPFLHFTLGEKYAAAIPLLTWLALMQGVRLIKSGSATVSLAHGHTTNALVANLMRVLLLPVAWYVVATGGSLLQVVWIGIFAEVFGLVLGLWLTVWRLRLPRRPLVLPFVASTALFVLAGFHASAQYSAADWVPGLWTGLGLVVLFVLALACMRDLIRYIRRRKVIKHDDSLPDDPGTTGL